MKTSWKCLEDIFARLLQHVLDTSSRHLCKTYDKDEHIPLDQDIFKTSSQDVRARGIYWSWSRCLEDIFWRQRQKTSLLRQRFAGKSHGLKSGDWAAHGLSVFFWEITLSTNLCVKSSSVAFAVWVWGVAPSCIKHCWLITISHPIERCI